MFSDLDNIALMLVQNALCFYKKAPCYAELFLYVVKYKQKIRTLFLLGKFGSDFSGLVPVAGVEPARYRYQRILSPSRLPIPSHRLD